MRLLKTGFLQDDSKFWNSLAFVVTLLALFKGFRLPNTWAATQAQVGYSRGFVKRGLFGTLIAQPLHLGSYVVFSCFSAALLLVLFVVFVVLVRSAGLRERCGSAFPAAVFGASYSTTYLAHLDGYLDVPLAALTIALLCIRNAKQRALVALPVTVLAVLTHELFLVVFFPVVLLSFALQALSLPERAARRRALPSIVALAVVALGTTTFTAMHSSADRQTARALEADIQRRVDFPVRPDFFEVFTRSAGDNLRIMLGYTHNHGWREAQLGCALILLPTGALLLGITWCLLEQSSISHARLAFLFCLAASLAPLAMNLLGWDVGRWYALAGLNCFLTLLCVCQFVPGNSLPEYSAFVRAAILVIAISMASGGFLMDHLEIRPFPFFSVSV